MVSVSGVSRVEIPPSFAYGGSGKNEVDLLVTIDGKNSLQLISRTYILTSVLREIRRGDTVSFEGILASDEPGLLFVRLSSIHIVSTSKKYKVKLKAL